MDKKSLMEKIRRNRQEWEALLSQIPEERLEQPGFCGAWSAKDVIAHIAWHEGQMVGVLRAHDLVGSELWDLPLDQRNAAIYEIYKDRPLAEVRHNAQQTYETLMKLLASFPAEDLINTASFPNMPPEWQPWELIANNTYEHYEDHGKGVLHA